MTYPRRHRSEYTAAVEPERGDDCIYIGDNDYVPDWHYIILSVHVTGEVMAEYYSDSDGERG